MKSAKILRQKISSNQLTVGMFATFNFWPGMVEMAMKTGFDYLIIDLEHVTFDAELVANGCAIGRMVDFPILVRPPSGDMVPVRLAMDLGPCGLLVPYIESLEALHVVRDAVYMKPRGKRRPGGHGNRWVTNYNYSSWKTEVEDDFIVLPQIESVLGLKNVEAIAKDPVTTAMAVGPYDLSADLGVCWEPNHKDLLGALDKIRDAAKQAGKNMWMIGDGADLVKRGYTFICAGEGTMFMENAMRETVARVRSGKPTAKSDQPLP